MAQSGMEPVAVYVYVREGAALAVGALGVVVLLSLFSYVSSDLTALSEGLSAQNLIGTLGAYSSFAFYWTFGFVAYWIPITLLVLSAALIYWRRYEVNWTQVYLRSGTTIAVLLPLTVLAEMHFSGQASLPVGSGGALGSVLTFVSVSFLQEVGTTILALVLTLIGLQVILGFSWLVVFEHTGKIIYEFCRNAKTFAAATVQVLGATMARLLELRRQRIEDRVAKTSANKPLQITDAQERFEPIVPARTAEEVNFEEPAEDPVPGTLIEPSIEYEPTVVKNTSKTNVRDRDILRRLPSIEILTTPSVDRVVQAQEKEALIAQGERLREILADYRVSIEVESIISGPVVSRFEIQLAPGSKVAKIVNLANDLAREIAVRAVRVVPVIPGKTVVGIEIPNPVRATVRLREILDCGDFTQARKPLTLALGKNIAGEPIYADLERMPHLLVAGTTGSGKSVGVNTMLLSLIYRLTPEDVRFIMIDPKMLELSVYEPIPHMLSPVVTDMQDAAKALQWSIGEMDRRYRLMKELQVRSLGGLNDKIDRAAKDGDPIMDPFWDPLSGEEQQEVEKLPLIVIVIDEFADMIMIVGKKLEQLIARIAQKARAAGIHLILATQRPSVDVITGLIKANIPCRISYQVSSQVDSRTILDQVGAEQLLGNGDMLYLPPGSSVPERVHGAFVSDEEVLNVVDDWASRGSPEYVNEITEGSAEDFDVSAYGITEGNNEADDLYSQAVAFVLDTKRASASALQTKFQIGWNKAARLMDQMEGQGVVSVPDNNGRRQVLKAEA